MHRILPAALATCIIGCAVSADEYDPAGERAAAQGKADGPGIPTKKWTFVFYGAGDNNLGDEIAAAVEHMEAVGSTADVNLIAFYDHTTKGAARVYLEKDPDETSIHSPGILQLGAVDSGIPHTLIEQMVWAISTYPAEHYALMIDGHGGGTPQIIAPDSTTRHSMTLSDLRQAVDYIHQRTRAPLDLLGGDTCLTQTVEQAVELEDAVDTIAMSQNVDYGWNYKRIAQALVDNPDMDAHALGTEMVDAYRAKYPDMPSLTMTALDTKAALDLEAGMSLLGDALRTYAESSTDARATLLGVFQSVYRPPHGVGYVDVEHLASLLRDRTNDQGIAYVAGELEALAKASTVASFISADIPTAHGLSVYLPMALNEDVLAKYRVSRFGHESTWDDFLAWWTGLEP
jgi:hypothetical protein